MAKQKIFIEVEKSDRNLILWFNDHKLVGLNYWQGIGDSAGDLFDLPDPTLTKYCLEYYKAKGEDYGIPDASEGDMYFPGPYFEEEIKCIDDAIWEYLRRETKHKVTLPKAQVDLIRKALAHYRNGMEQFIGMPTESDDHAMFDLLTLEAMMSYEITVTLSDQSVADFGANHGIDFPDYL
jgi:hypothetical protein